MTRLIPSIEELPLYLQNNLSIVLGLWLSDLQIGRRVVSIHILPTSWVYYILDQKSKRSYCLFFPYPSVSSWLPLEVCTPTLEATGLLSSCPHSSVLQEPPCPALTFLYLPHLSRTLCFSQPSLCPPLAIYMFPVQLCALLSHLHPCFVPLSFPMGFLQAIPAQNDLTLVQIPRTCLALTTH